MASRTAAASSNEKELNDAVDRADSERAAQLLQEAVSISSSSSTTMVAKMAKTVGVKRKEPAAKVFLPPTPSRNDRTAGGKKKPEGVVFQATYESSRVLTNALSALKDARFNFFPFIFTANGLEISAIENTRVMMVILKIPKTSFIVYKNLAQNSVVVQVSAASIASLKASASNNTSISFMYDQYQNPDEVLHIWLYPRFEDMKAERIMHASFKPMNEETDDIQPDCEYQYKISVPVKSSTFLDDLSYMAKQATVVTLMLADSAFEMSGVGDTVETVQTMTFPAVVDPKTDGERIAALAGGFFVIERLPETDARFTMLHFRGYKIASAYLRAATSLAKEANCSALTMQMGVRDDQNVQTGYSEVPLHLKMQMGDNVAPFSVEFYVAPKES